MSEQACCSHSRITRITEDHPLGYRSEYWKCDTCETRFAPELLMQGRVLRDWFAGKALQPMVSGSSSHMPADVAEYAVLWAELSYIIADAMIAQREKK